MATATLTSTGQTSIPAHVRASLGGDTGDRIPFVAFDNGEFAIMAATHSATDLKGLIGKPAKAVTIDDLHRAIAAQGCQGGRHAAPHLTHHPCGAHSTRLRPARLARYRAASAAP